MMHITLMSRCLVMSPHLRGGRHTYIVFGADGICIGMSIGIGVTLFVTAVEKLKIHGGVGWGGVCVWGGGHMFLVNTDYYHHPYTYFNFVVPYLL